MMKRMKKWMSLALSLALAMGLTACGGSKEEAPETERAADTAPGTETDREEK